MKAVGSCRFPCQFAVFTARKVTQKMGLSQLVIGLTVVALGTIRHGELRKKIGIGMLLCCAAYFAICV